MGSSTPGGGRGPAALAAVAPRTGLRPAARRAQPVGLAGVGPRAGRAAAGAAAVGAGRGEGAAVDAPDGRGRRPLAACRTGQKRHDPLRSRGWSAGGHDGRVQTRGRPVVGCVGC